MTDQQVTDKVPQLPAPNLLPLSIEQEWMYSLRKLHPNTRMSITRAFDIRGELDTQLFLHALRTVVRQHQGLRVQLDFTELGAPGQAVRGADYDPPISCQAIIGRSREQFEAYARRLSEQEVRARWNPVRDPLYRLRLLRRTTAEHLLLVTFDHLAFDNSSLEIFAHQLWQEYGAGGSTGPGGATEAAELASVLQRQRRRYGRRADSVNARYWAGRYDLAPPVWQPSATLCRTTSSVPERRAIGYTAEPDVVARLRASCRETGRSPLEIFVAIFSWIVFQLTRQDRIVIHVPLDGREADEKNVIGMFTSLQPLIISRTPGRATSYISPVHSEIFGSFAHRHVAGYVEPDAAERRRGRWHLPPQRALAVNYTRDNGAQAAGAQPDSIRVTRARFLVPQVGNALASLALSIYDENGSLGIELFYSPQSISAEVAAAVLQQLDTELRDIASGPAAADPNGGPPWADEQLPPLTPLLDAEGKVCLHVALTEVQAALLSHPAVTSADVDVGKHPAGGSEVVATVSTAGQVSDAALRDFCLNSPVATQYMVPPGRIVRHPA